MGVEMRPQATSVESRECLPPLQRSHRVFHVGPKSQVGVTPLHGVGDEKNCSRRPLAPVIQTASLTLCAAIFIPTPAFDFHNTLQMIKRLQYIVNSHQA